MSTIIENKRFLRTQMRARRRSLSPDQWEDLGAAFSIRCAALPAFRRAARIACYWPLWNEINILPLMKIAMDLGKEIHLPVISNHKMWFSPWSGNELSPDRKTGIVQPHKNSRRLANRLSLDLVFVPLLAFDRDGFRLGQGGGFYDRYFQRQQHCAWKKPVLIGAAYDFQEVANVPAENWDVPLTKIVTNNETIFCNYDRGNRS